MIGEGLGEWFEAPSYEEGGGGDGGAEGFTLGRGLGVPPVLINENFKSFNGTWGALFCTGEIIKGRDGLDLS